MIEFIKMTCRKNSEQKNQNRTKNKMLQVGVMLIKLVFRQSNIVCIGILSLLIVKTNNLANF